MSRCISLIMALQKSIEIFKRISTYHIGIRYNIFCNILISFDFPCIHCFCSIDAELCVAVWWLVDSPLASSVQNSS
ncbi:hypothetical protein RchiOBHm_Chr1g0371081 [Rosa chinensis]|uniref:Uncharacterized protein n=1 Tax=Rosa chinensis TaxID=74649 RepID=A0A2P6SLH4_ROSCH|nr:hypothetical protein RchiOBHm_Chr1g0371081 [Rosa chinensis]